MIKKLFLLQLLTLLCNLLFAQTPELVIQEGNYYVMESIKYSNDGKYFMCANETEAKIYETESGFLIKSFDFSDRNFVCFSPTAQYIVSTSKNQIYLTDVESKNVIQLGEKLDDDDVSWPMVFSPDGKYLAVVMCNYIDIYDVSTLEKKSILKDSGYYFYDRIAWSPDGSSLSIIVSDQEGYYGSINIIYNLLSKKIVSVYDAGEQLYYTDISPDGKYVVCTSDNEVFIRYMNSNLPYMELQLSHYLEAFNSIISRGLIILMYIFVLGSIFYFYLIFKTRKESNLEKESKKSNKLQKLFWRKK